MKRIKSHKIKREKPEPSASASRDQEEHDLAYYIHDRVELVHQIFSSIKPKDLKSMTPECIRHLTTDNIKELCTEELLGISSKRLCAILDGAQPPSDTESSSPSLSPDQLETISLDSISSDEDILSQTSSKKSKKHKHRRRESKSKKKSKKSKHSDEENEEKSKASRAGLTVLELLELQARARAIRAQLQQEQAAKIAIEPAPAATNNSDSSTDEVEVKEEPAEIVEISSSEDEKPQINNEKSSSPSKVPDRTDNAQKIIKRVNDLVITVPQKKKTKKITLKRSKVIPEPSHLLINTNNASSVETAVVVDKASHVIGTSSTTRAETLKGAVNVGDKDLKSNEKQKRKPKKKNKKKSSEKDGSDHDEITLQLSDSEKMDLLEDLDHKNYDKVSSSSTEDSESSSSDSEEERNSKTTAVNKKFDNNKQKTKSSLKEKVENNTVTVEIPGTSTKTNEKEIIDNSVTTNESIIQKAKDVNNLQINSSENEMAEIDRQSESKIELCIDSELLRVNEQLDAKICEGDNNEKQTKDFTNETEKINNESEIENIESFSTQNDKDVSNINITVDKPEESDKNVKNIQQDNLESVDRNGNVDENFTQSDTIKGGVQETASTSSSIIRKESTKNLSDGELTDRDSSEVEAVDLKPEVVCISDEETNHSHKKKKNKKKEKKNKKEKKSKKSKADFREGCDQNFYVECPETDVLDNSVSVDNRIIDKDKINENHIEQNEILNNKTLTSRCDDDVYEILELSDDSSCYEVEGTVLSKEPTAEEIEALSAKIDEIEKRQEVITDEEIREHERAEAEKTEGNKNDENVEHISWKDRYLESKKVKKVLSTSNILNALRKKNKELKIKLEESRNKELEVDVQKQDVVVECKKNLEEGSIDQYLTLEGSTKYVDPVKETIPDKDVQNDTQMEATESVVTREMKKDAKQLLKMYKRLIKYNDMNKEKNPSKKKKKKQKKKKEEQPTLVNSV
ncbi:uncharacterized protein LOC131845297 [Achroia grisella]|uniref:uncharacterized protein LOC131845297 n=1 Tax=Achroia grisella TaxID=688607 RepID=UPI0027D22BB9|nr:uncharacterized protein LOC131845297 [Achroia grisella]